MATRTGRHVAQRAKAKAVGRKAENSPPMRIFARMGFFARGLMYIVIGWIAVEIAFGKTSQQADRSGALQTLGRTPAGEIALWVLVVGFFGMAVWRLSQVLFDRLAADRRKAIWSRLVNLGKAAVYVVLGYGVADYAIGAGSPPSTDQQSVDLTATVMRHPGGRALIIVIGLVLIGVGLYLGYQAWRERFRDVMEWHELPQAGRRVVEWLGRVGGVARGLVFLIAGIFLIVAAAEANPRQAKGIDSSLRELAAAPLGPWLLALVAIGLIMFGLFSCCETRWRRV
ncbi:MAG TPA: DUF1206 domain-containing protein [Trebonia sp.]|jgi:hypothetical protein|nr:DUF1206 domain-containing protein [Trebonia sp.]